MAAAEASTRTVSGNYVSSYKQVCATRGEEIRSQAEPVCFAWDPGFLPVMLRTPVGFYQQHRHWGAVWINRGKTVIKGLGFG